jgi:hypothetical protein
MKSGGSSVIVALVLGGLLVACGGSEDAGEPGTPGGGEPVSYDGSWLVTVTVATCYDITASGTVTVSGGAFAGTLFTYCANPQSGDTYIPTSGCGTDITQTVSIEDGAFDGSVVDGNLYLAGGACNGGNGFYGTTSSATAGTASSYWGTLTFSKQ